MNKQGVVDYIRGRMEDAEIDSRKAPVGSGLANQHSGRFSALQEILTIVEQMKGPKPLPVYAEPDPEPDPVETPVEERTDDVSRETMSGEDTPKDPQDTPKKRRRRGKR